MKTYAATLSIVLRPGAATSPAEADAILRGMLGSHPEILDGQYARVNGEVRTPHEVEIELPASSPSADTPRPFVTHSANAPAGAAGRRPHDGRDRPRTRG